MIFKNLCVSTFTLLVFSGLAQAEPDICKSIDQSVKISQARIIDSNLVISVTPTSLQKRRPSESDPVAAKKQLILAFNQYFQKKMNWNYLQIDARGEQFYIAKCSNFDNYIFQIPTENVSVTKLDKPRDGSSEKDSLDNFSSDEFRLDNSSEGFK
jgi:hypothetical protein